MHERAQEYDAARRAAFCISSAERALGIRPNGLRLAEIRTISRTDMNRYNADQKLQAEERTLLDMQAGRGRVVKPALPAAARAWMEQVREARRQDINVYDGRRDIQEYELKLLANF